MTAVPTRTATRLTALFVMLAACGGGGGGGTGRVEPAVPSRVQLLDAANRTGEVGTTLAAPIRVRVTDAGGRAVPSVTVTWTATGGGLASPATSTTNADGVAETSWTLGPTPGSQQISATVSPALSAALSAEATISALSVTRVSPATLTPGAPVTVEGTGFVAGGATSLTVNGVAATITEVTPTRIAAVVPSQGSLPCAPTAPGRVTVRRTAGSAADSVVTPTAVEVASVYSLARGESVAIADSARVGCLRLEQGGRYLLSIYNTRTDLFAPLGSGVRVRGTSATAAVAATSVADATPTPLLARATADAGAGGRADDDRLHAQRLEHQHALVRRLGPPAAWAPPRRPGGARLARAAVETPAVGDRVTFKAISPFAPTCDGGTPIGARVVYVGPKTVVYEDTLSAVAGTMDAELRRVGEELDLVQLPILERYFGNALAMNERLGADGRVAMLFTRFVTDSVFNIAGYTSTCDFYPAAQASGGNQRAIFYARLPSRNEAASEWRYNLRSTVIHEVKHVASYAERFARASGATPPLEVPWLEEATARLAEELYARTFSGATWKGNAGYDAVRCEVTRCEGWPRMMTKHFEALASFYARVDSLTPLGGVTAGDATYYASGWLLVRWAVDHYAADEAAFTRALTTETSAPGLANLVRRAGRPAPDLLADWSLALAADDRPGLIVRRSEVTVPSWNLRDVFRGLNAANRFGFPLPFPLLVRQVAGGTFSADVAAIRAWSAGFVEIAGAATLGPQLLELRGLGGAPLPAGIGVALLRVE